MISTHILDTSVGNPAKGVSVSLEIEKNHEWVQIGNGQTNDDGRFVFDNPSLAGNYRIKFSTQEYYSKNQIDSFFLETPVAFKITNIDRKYHIPLLVNPFGYSTYRGS